MNLENDLKRSLHGSHRLASERGSSGGTMTPGSIKITLKSEQRFLLREQRADISITLGVTLQLKHCRFFCKQIGLLLWGVGQAGNGTLMTSLGWPPADSAGSTYGHAPADITGSTYGPPP